MQRIFYRKNLYPSIHTYTYTCISINNIAFNESKIVLLRFSFSTNTINDSYTISGHQLTLKDCHRDLGVVIPNKVCWSVHYCTIASKAYKTIGLICRTYSISSSVHCCKLLHLPLFRPILVYCSSVRRPDLLENITRLENIQRRAAKCTLNNLTLDYKSRLISLQLFPLMMTYKMNDLAFFLKYLKSPSKSFNITDFVIFCSSSTPSSTMKLKHSCTNNNTSHHRVAYRIFSGEGNYQCDLWPVGQRSHRHQSKFFFSTSLPNCDRVSVTLKLMYLCF